MFAAALVAALSVLTACGSSDGAGPGGSTKTTAASVAGVPTMAQLYKGLGEAPPTTGPTPPKDKTVWWVSCGDKIPACATPTNSAREAAALLGWTLKVADGNLNAGGGFQTALRQAIAAKPDAIIVSAMDCALIEQPLKEAKADGIPVVGALANDCDSPVSGNGGSALFAGPSKYTTSAPTTADYLKSWGTAGAAYIINKSGGKAKIINAVLQAPIGEAIDAGFTSELKKCGGCSIVDSFTFQATDTTAGGPFGQALQAALVKNPDADVVYMALDSELQGGGGVQIVKQSGRDILVVGGQGVDPAVAAMAKKGDIAALTTVQSPRWPAYAAMDTVVRLLAEEPTVNEGVGVIVVDAEHGIGSDGVVKSTSFDVKAAYSKLWGVSE
jgi:ribose transport system substrate-binding protein